MITREDAVSRAHGMTLNPDQVEAAWRRLYPTHAEFYDLTGPPAAAAPAPAEAHPTDAGLDHRALAHHAAIALAQLTQHLDPALPARLTVGHRGRLDVQLFTEASLRDVAALADRIGLAEHSYRECDDGVHHSWVGGWEGHEVRVDWIDKPERRHPGPVPEGYRRARYSDGTENDGLVPIDTDEAGQ